jgi:hypothetical protein
MNCLEAVHFLRLTSFSSLFESISMRLNKDSITGISLDAAGLIALADLSTIAQRTAITGSASVFDVLVLAPGIHTQQDASNVNGGEFPATGAMTTGYVFRIENQATVSYLQSIGRSGALVTVNVVQETSRSWLISIFRELFRSNQVTASFLYVASVVLTIIVLAILGAIHDFWAVGVLGMLIFARFLNMVVIRRRTQIGWKGALEPNVKGDLLVLLSQDRWVRMKGMVDDLKAVTAG